LPWHLSFCMESKVTKETHSFCFLFGFETGSHFLDKHDLKLIILIPQCSRCALPCLESLTAAMPTATPDARTMPGLWAIRNSDSET
jgi:hypothetical protein